jgi:hypothetical protein
VGRDRRRSGAHGRQARRLLQQQLPVLRAPAAARPLRRSGQHDRRVPGRRAGQCQQRRHQGRQRDRRVRRRQRHHTALRRSLGSQQGRLGERALPVAQWFEAHRPYAWSIFPDCTIAGEAATEVTIKQLAQRPAAYALGDLNDKPRRIGVIAPNNLEYQQCVDASLKTLHEANDDVALRLDYTLDISTLQSTAASILAKLKANHITSVTCACNPILQMYLAKQATAQDYFPEWLIAGVGFIDFDLGGQAVTRQAGTQWNRAFGGSSWAAPQPPETSAGYKAYKSVRGDTPSKLVDVVYQELMVIALGVQMAGPDLTPQHFETGLFNWPVGTGQGGRWDFSPGHYTPQTDARLLWSEPDKVSAFNGRPGSYADDGKRYVRGPTPEGAPEVFE